MASFHFEIKSGKRGTANDHGAYIWRNGFHARRGDLVASGYGNMPFWAAHDPSIYWKCADMEERVNGAAYREYVIALPNELKLGQNMDVVKRLIESLVGEKPFQFAIHAPISSLEGQRNLHLHLMYSDRVPDGIDRPAVQMFKRYNPTHPERGGCKKDSGGKTAVQLRDEVITKRKATAEILNVALQKHGHDVRVDHRSLKDQGKDKKPERHLGPSRIRGMSSTDKELYVATRHAGN